MTFKLTHQSEAHTSSASSVSTATLFKMFVGPRASAYVQALQNPTRFNWGGLLFGAYWLLYRKMYAQFFLLLSILFFLGMLGAVIGLPWSILLGISVLPHVVYGFIGSDLYARFAQEKVHDYQKHPKYSPQVFAESGGTSWSQPILWLGIQMVVGYMLTTPFLQY